MDEALIEPTPILGGWHVKDVEVELYGPMCVDVMQMLYNYRIVLSDRAHQCVAAGWCYYGHGVMDNGAPRTMDGALLMAMAAAKVWDGTGEPVGYDKRAL